MVGAKPSTTTPRRRGRATRRAASPRMTNHEAIRRSLVDDGLSRTEVDRRSRLREAASGDEAVRMEGELVDGVIASNSGRTIFTGASGRDGPAGSADASDTSRTTPSSTSQAARATHVGSIRDSEHAGPRRTCQRRSDEGGSINSASQPSRPPPPRSHLGTLTTHSAPRTRR